MVEIFNFIKVIFIAIFLLIIFSFLTPMINDSVENWKTTIGDTQPFLTFLISGINFWIFLGFMIGILGAIVYGTQIWGNKDE